MAALSPFGKASSQSPEGRECVILLHGLARTAIAMSKLESTLRGQYFVVNNTYPSRKHTIEDLAELAIGNAIQSCHDATKIHFVTHSLGGILVRQYLSQHKLEALGNVVMLGPPNQGSELVDFFQSYRLINSVFSSVNGPAATQLGTLSNSHPIALGPVNFSLGVIAGTENFNPFLNPLMPGQHDGKVTVESSKVEGMTDHIVLPTTHTFMMRNDQVIKQTLHFLKHSKFLHEQPDNSEKTKAAAPDN